MKSPWTETLVEELKYLFIEQKFGQAAISRILSDKYRIEISRNSVTGKLHRLGIPGMRADATEEERATRRLRTRHTYNDKRRERRAAERAERRPTLKIVSNGAGTGLRLIETVTGDLPSFACSEVVSRDLTIGQLGPNDCRYLAGDEAPWLYCGHPVQEKSSFCPHHHARVWTKPIKQEKKAAA